MSGVEELTRQSKFIFRGTVTRLHAATMSAVPVAEETAVVKVDEVYAVPPVLEDQTGNEVTVQLHSIEGVSVGQQAIFFTNPWLYGDGVAVVEVGHTSANNTAAANNVRSQVSSVFEGLPDEEIKEHLERAEIVVAGEVINTHPAAAAETGMPDEHHPDWWIALVSYDEVLKGDPAEVAQPVSVAFAASIDVVWHDAPKLAIGDRRIYILHAEALPDSVAATYALLHPVDVQPLDRREHIRRLLAEITG